MKSNKFETAFQQLQMLRAVFTEFSESGNSICNIILHLNFFKKSVI